MLGSQWATDHNTVSAWCAATKGQIATAGSAASTARPPRGRKRRGL